MRPIRWATIVALLLAVALTATACGEEADDVADDVGDDPGEEEQPAEDAEPADEDPAEDETAEEPTDATVAVAETELGDALVDADGMTLYLFEADSDGESTCYDDCADAWPPLLDDDPTAGEAADDGLLGTTERDDGSVQVTYDGWPLYHWAGDSEPGDIEGQGVEDVWWLVDPAGNPIVGADGEDDEDDEDVGGY